MSGAGVRVATTRRPAILALALASLARPVVPDQACGTETFPLLNRDAATIERSATSREMSSSHNIPKSRGAALLEIFGAIGAILQSHFYGSNSQDQIGACSRASIRITKGVGAVSAPAFS